MTGADLPVVEAVMWVGGRRARMTGWILAGVFLSLRSFARAGCSASRILLM
jgi:hypothetical protein